ncbi:hypothetical protein ACOMHN_006937 [Nucella lapillus]
MARLKLRSVPPACLCRLAVLAIVASLSAKAMGSSSGEGTATASASFSEGESGQMTVVNEKGIPVKQHHHGKQNEAKKETEQFDPSAWKRIHEEQEDIEKKRGQQIKEKRKNGKKEKKGKKETQSKRGKGKSRKARSLSRQKRFMSGSKYYVWPKGIVPYDFNMDILTPYYINEAKVAMTRYHKYTCIRFVPWVLEETMTKYGLTEESHVTITKGDGCAAHQGNIHSINGQYNSCCSRGTCTHELGHTLALYHEHQNPWRDQLIKLDIKRVIEGLQWTYEKKYESSVEVYQYDVTSTMHYGGSAFPIMYEDLKPLIKFSNQYYMYKDVSLYHSCKELYCANFTGQCHNDGFVTVVDDQCSCLCPPGLDPSTGCATTITQVSTSSSWPNGPFALLSSISGCPGNNEFVTGSWQHQGAGDNAVSDGFLLAGTFDTSIFRYQFCTKEHSSSSDSAHVWDKGQYCILRVGGVCPDGFEPGSIQFDDHVNSTGQAEGRLPDGQFTDTMDTRLEFCCRNDGFTSTPLINLPNTEPFVLLYHSAASSCQEVAGMHSAEQYIWFDSYREIANMSGSYPYVSKNTFFKIWFCHYVPADHNCGGEVTLTRNNRQAVIQSPNFPSPYGTNMECNWLIKADEAGGQVMLDFDVMKVTSDGDCKDSLELRYNLPGQPGIRYCGDGLARTIRSLNNVIVLTLRSDSHQVATDIGFNLTTSLYWPEQDSCYEPSTKGSLYRGQKNYTRGMKPCLPWTQVANCKFHGFHTRDFGSDLSENYCRNPDDTAMPWCYTDVDCSRDYCDVCNIERIYDRSTLCPSSVCEKSQEEIVKLGCVHTCGLAPASAPVREATCGQPESPSDAQFKHPANISDSSPVGQTVSLQCSTGAEDLNVTCLAEGQWSPAGYVCGACSDGWAFFNGSCYRHFWEKQTFAGARQVCAGYGGLVASMKNKEEMVFVSSLRHHLRDLWNSATYTEGPNEYRWEDSTPLTYTNWYPSANPTSPGNKLCVVVYTEYYNITWNNYRCDSEYPFVCKYGLSDRTLCADRHRNCTSMLLKLPDTCTQQPDFADQMCPYSCGRCLTESTPCTLPALDNVTVVSPQGQQSVTRGSVVQLACLEGFVVTQGQLSLACGEDGQFIGTLPVCEDPDTLIQDSNDVDLIPRPQTTSSRYAYTSTGSNLGITRHGVIKQWKFYSRQKGNTFFQVLRPNPAGGNYSFILVGQNQVLTKGQGEETYDLDEADWITVQPGDRIGIFEAGSFRGYVPYTYCDESTNPGDFGATWGYTTSSYGDFSKFVPNEFTSDVNCRQFSFKAVIHPLSSKPAEPDMATSQVGIVARSTVGSSRNVYLGDSTNFYIPTNGYIKRWEFYVEQPGSGSLTIWRKREDKGVRKFQLIHQTKVTITSSEPRLYMLEVPEEERTLVQAGDIIGVLYGADRLGIPYSLCSQESYPESYNVYWSEPLTPDTVLIDDIYSFSYTGGSYLCRTFSFRAIVEQGQATPEPRLPDMLTSDVDLISRSYVGAAKNVYLGDSNNFHVPVAGSIKEWQFYFKYGGSGAFQVWRRWSELGMLQYRLVGQNPITINSSEAGVHTLTVPEEERIEVEAGDIIGFLYGADKLGIPYSVCDNSSNPDSNNIHWFEPLTPESAAVNDIYQFGLTGGSWSCRIFSFRAVIEQTIPDPGLPDLRTSDVPLIPRSYVGSSNNVYLGNSSNYKFPANGFVKEWQFYATQGGVGALQVWRSAEGVQSFTLIGQNKLDITLDAAQPYRYYVPEGERIEVQEGDIIGILYGSGNEKIDIPYSLCDGEDPASNNIFWYDSLTPETAVINQTYQFSYTGGAFFCRVFAFRAVIEQIKPTPPSTEPALRTNDFALVYGYTVGAAENVYLSDSLNYYIPADGLVTEWQFYSRNAGSGAFQVWRRRDDLAIRKFEFRGENALNLTNNTAGTYSYLVPEGERIEVKKGDIIGFLYGEQKMGLPYTFCRNVSDPYNKNTSWYEPMIPGEASVGDAYQFSYTGSSYSCRIFSFRAVIQEAQIAPDNTILTSHVALKYRGAIGAATNAYLGDSLNYYIPVDGHVKEWRFFCTQAGTGSFTVWRRRDDLGVRRFQLIGQNPINQTSEERRVYNFPVPEGERIAVQAGDIIGFIYGEDKMGLPYSFCSNVTDPYNTNTAWYQPITPETAVINHTYAFGFTSGQYLCRIFSFKAVIEQGTTQT